MSLASSPTSHPLAPHARFSVEQFHRLCEAVPEQRLELIDGEVLEVIAKGTRHSSVVNRPSTSAAAVNPNPIWLWCDAVATPTSRPTPAPPTPFW